MTDLKLTDTPQVTSLQEISSDDYLKLYYVLKQKFKTSYLFESSTDIDSRQQGRYYVIGFDPMYTVQAKNNELRIHGKDIDKTIKSKNPYSDLKSLLPKMPAASRYQGGLVGYFSYETANYFEPSLKLDEHKDFPVFELGLYVDGLVYDSETDELEYYTFHKDRSDKLKDILKNLKAIVLPTKVKSVKSKGDSIEKNKYLKIIDNTIAEIKKGNSFQVEVGIRKNYQITGDKFAIYNQLRQTNPSPYMYYMQFENREIFGASPELVISSTDGSILSTPCAGTIQRYEGDEPRNKKLARQLLNDPKELAEHAMLVDLHRNDIAKVSRYGSVKVKDYMYLVKLKYVQHISSHIVGELREDKDSFDLLASVMPCGVLTGAPKIETMKIINRNEKSPRGPYGGAVGRFSFNGDCAFAMPIRSLFCVGDFCYNQASGGVVFDSQPEKEYEEVMAKLRGMEKAIEDVTND